MHAGSVVIINPAQVHACNPVDVLHPCGQDEQQFMLTQASQEQQDRKTEGRAADMRQAGTKTILSA